MKIMNHKQELEDYIAEQKSILDRLRHDEKLQRRTIIAYEMGGSVSLYDWIHRNDNTEPVQIILPEDWCNIKDEWITEFTRLMNQELHD